MEHSSNNEILVVHFLWLILGMLLDNAFQYLPSVSAGISFHDFKLHFLQPACSVLLTGAAACRGPGCSAPPRVGPCVFSDLGWNEKQLLGSVAMKVFCVSGWGQLKPLIKPRSLARPDCKFFRWADPACIPSWWVGWEKPKEHAFIISGARCVLSRGFSRVRIRLVLCALLIGSTNRKALC